MNKYFYSFAFLFTTMLFMYPFSNHIQNPIAEKSSGVPKEVTQNEVTNLALNKYARQSSDFDAGIASASKAVDGNTDGKFQSNEKNSVARTRDEKSPWWEVDLGAEYEIEKIVIWNRTDCCSEDLKNFIVITSTTPIWESGKKTNADGMILGPYAAWPKNQSDFTINIDELEINKKARYVRVILNLDLRDRGLSLAEVQVFGK